MHFHDFPWGAKLAHWDQKPMSQADFNTRISAVTSLNSNPNAVSFALCSIYDVRLLRDAHHAAGWTGGEYNLWVDKTNVIDFTSEKAGLITHTNAALVSFRGKQSESVWCFAPDREDRSQRWQTKAVLNKHKAFDAQVINPTEQPVDVDRRAMEHWSAMGDYVFCDGFGSGTTFLAALEVGRSCVGTEPDHRQWEAAGQRLDKEIMSYLKFDDQQARRKAERLRAEAEEKEAQARAEKASQKAKSLKEGKKGRKKRKAVEEEKEDKATVSESPSDVHFSFSYCFGRQRLVRTRVHCPFLRRRRRPLFPLPRRAPPL